LFQVVKYLVKIQTLTTSKSSNCIKSYHTNAKTDHLTNKEARNATRNALNCKPGALPSCVFNDLLDGEIALHRSSINSNKGTPNAVQTGARTPVGVAKYNTRGNEKQQNQMSEFSTGPKPQVPLGINNNSKIDPWTSEVSFLDSNNNLWNNRPNRIEKTHKNKTPKLPILGVKIP